MSQVIDKIKEKYPAYAEVPDDQLTLKIAEKYPQYLDADPEFKADYGRLAIGASISAAQQGTAQLTRVLSSPAAGEAAQEGRMPGPTPAGTPPDAPTDTLRPQTAYERFRFGPVGQALLGKTSIEREHFKTGMGPIEGLTHGINLDLKPSDIAEAARQFTAAQLGVAPDKLAPKPTDESVAQAMHGSKTAALTIGSVKGLEDLDSFFTSPMGVATLGIGTLPKVAQRMIALGFSAQMARSTPEIARQLGEEYGKPEDQRDYQKIGNLTTQAIATTGFTVAGVLHGVMPGKPQIETVADNISKTAPATAEALQQQGENAIQRQTTKVLQPVQPQPGESKGEVPAQGTSAEAGTRSEPALSAETQERVNDVNRYNDLTQQFRALTLEKKFAPEGQAIQKQIEQVKNKYGGKPPTEPEYVTHAAYTDEDGNVHVGANHPEILEKLGVEGFDERESRNTPQFGYRTNLRPFVGRVEGGEVATASGQNMEPFEPGEQVHSDQIESTTEPGKALGDAVSPPVIQAGAAHITEIPETGAGGEKYGISAAVRAERAQAGQVAPIESGTSVKAADSIVMGREMNAADPGLPERFMQQFESDPNKNTSKAMIASVRAHGESLARAAREAEGRFGTDSPEWREADERLNQWDKRTKPIQTEWASQGEAQQGWTDLDTGSISGLQRERRRLTDKFFTDEEKTKAGDLAKQVRDAEEETNAANEALNDELRANDSPETRAQRDRDRASTAIDAANKAQETVEDLQKQSDEAIGQEEKTTTRTKLKAAESQRDAAQAEVAEAAKEEAKSQAAADEHQKLLDAGEKARKDLEAAHKAVKDAAAAVEDARKSTKSVEQVQLDAARRAFDAANKVVREAAVARANAENKARVAKVVRDQKTANVQVKAARSAEAAAVKVLRDAASARAKAETKARVAEAARAKGVESVQVKAALKAQEAVWKTLREAARRAAAAERKILGDSSIPVWNRAKSYLTEYDADGRQVPAAIRFDDLRNKIAADLGMTTDKVTRLLARSKRMKYLTDDAWIKQQRERNIKTKAKLWVQGLDMPAYEKFIRALPRVLFKIRVGFHGTVALGTHAPAVAFDPRFWGTYVRDFGNMYKMVGSRGFYEAQMQDLLRRKNFVTAKRGGLVVDPFKHEDFKSPGFASDTADKISKAMSDSLGVDPKWFSQMGERGYSILKVLRMDMFDQHWDALPKSLQTDEMAKSIADGVNHITGVVQTPAPFKAELVAFAPKLQMSRGAFLFGDPLRAGRTGLRAGVGAAQRGLGISGPMPEVTPAEAHFAIEQLKSKAYMAATLGSLLALNQGILMLSDSKQKVNFTDPFRSDFGKFKIAGLNVSYGNPLITMFRLPIRLGTLAVGPGGKLRKIIYPDEDAARIAWEYLRSQASPAFSLVLDQVFREDWQKRQLPNSERPEPKRLAAQGIGPYTQGEYWTQQALPIPAQEFMREVWQDGFGMTSEQAKSYGKAALSTVFMAGTGGRVSKDTEAPQ
jgi:hypothetical protein